MMPLAAETSAATERSGSTGTVARPDVGLRTASRGAAKVQKIQRESTPEDPVVLGFGTVFGDPRRRLYTGQVCRMTTQISEITVVERLVLSLARDLKSGISKGSDGSAGSQPDPKGNVARFAETILKLQSPTLHGFVPDLMRTIPEHLMRRASWLTRLEQRSLYLELKRAVSELRRAKGQLREVIELSDWRFPPRETGSERDPEALAPEMEFARDLAARAHDARTDAKGAHSLLDGEVAANLLRAD